MKTETSLQLTQGLHFGVSAEDYHADPAPEPSLSSSLARVLLQKSPRHAHHAHVRLGGGENGADRSKFDLGTAAHAMLLEGLDSAVVVEAKDWRSKVAQEARDKAHEEGRTALLKKDHDAVRSMVEAAHEQLALSPHGNPFLREGRAEATVVWEEDGLWLRARPDWMGQDWIVWDYKTTKVATPSRWDKVAYDLCYDVQAAFYLRGLKAVTGRDWTWYWLVQEAQAPHVLAVRPMHESLAISAAHKLEGVLELWSRCMKSDKWPGYASQDLPLMAPPWEINRLPVG